MPDLKFSTSANLQGFHDLETALDKLHAHVKTVAADMQKLSVSQSQTGAGALASGGGSLEYGSPSPGTPRPREAAPGMHTPSGGRSVRARQGAKPSGQYDLNTISGLESWDQNVYAPAQTVLQMMDKGQSPAQGHGASRTSSSRSRAASVPGMVPLLGSHFKSRSMPGSTPYYEDWFNRIGQPDVQSLLPSNLQESYQEALGMYVGGHKNVAADFYQNYASEANQPAPPPVTFLSRFKQHASTSGGIGGFLSSGLKGAIGGTLIEAGLGGGAAGSAAGMGAAGLIGGLADGLPGIGAALIGFQALSAITSQVTAGMSTFKQTIPAFSEMSHALDNAGNSAIGFQQNVQMAGARVAMTNVQATQTAQSLMGVFGTSVSQAGYASLVQQTGMAALTNGLTPAQQTQLVAGIAGLGITNGVGSTLSTGQYNNMFLNAVDQSHMQGRQGALGTGLLSVYSGLGSVNPIISNPLGTAAQYTAMNATGIQGLQGTRGAQLMATMNASLASGSGMSQMLDMAAIYQASGGKITNPFEMQSILEQGTAAKIGNTTLGAQLAKMVTSLSPDKYTQAGIFSAIMGTSVNQSASILASHMFNAKSISTKNDQYTRMTASDITTAGSATTNLLGSKWQAALNKGTSLLAQGAGIANGFYADGKINTLYSPLYQPPGAANNNPVLRARLGNPMAGTGYTGSLSNIMLGIMHQESGGQLYAINDNSTGKPGIGTAYYPKTKSAYMALADKLIAEHHQLALGPYQQEMGNAGVTVANAVNLPYATKTATALLLSKLKATGGNLSQALEDYSGGAPGYAQAVESYASSISSGGNANSLNLSNATITAIGNAVAYALRQNGPKR